MSERQGSLTTEEKEILRAELERMIRDLGTQKAVAERLAVTQQTVSQAIKKGIVGYSVARRVARSRGYDSFEDLCRSRSAAVARDPAVVPPEAKLKTVGERLRYAIDASSLAMSDIDRLVGERPGYTRKIAGGMRDEPDVDVLKRLATALDVSFTWLLLGGDEMRLEAEKADVTGLAEALEASLEKNAKNPLDQAIAELEHVLTREVKAEARKRFAGQEEKRSRTDWLKIIAIMQEERTRSLPSRQPPPEDPPVTVPVVPVMPKKGKLVG